MRRAVLAGLLVLPALLGGIGARAATVTVTSGGDGVATDGVVTLREALLSLDLGSAVDPDVVAVGAYGTDDRIEFAIPGAGVHTLQPASPLPAVSVPMTIDGTSQPGASANTRSASDDAVLLIEIDGSAAGSGSVGLSVDAGGSGSTLRGLVINRFVFGGSSPGGAGIVLDGADDCVIAGNFLGTDPAGTTAFGNGGSNVAVLGGSGHRIGGADPADRNLLAGSPQHGVSLASNTSDDRVLGNFIGVGADGLTALPNFVGLSIDGLASAYNLVGGSAAGEGNVISGNASRGILIGLGADSAVIQGNFIGTDATGTVPIPNGSDGVHIGTSGGSCDGNVVGGLQPEQANVIAFNHGAGIAVAGAVDNLQNTFRGNRIFANDGLGIDLGDDGVTANDPGDGDGGHNHLQNYPELASAVASGGVTAVTGLLESDPGRPFLVSFYASSACDPSGFGEGEQYLGFAQVSTDGSGSGPIDVSLPAVPPGWFVTAVASVSDPTGDSSEFSACVVVTAASVLEIPALGRSGLVALALVLAAAAAWALRRRGEGGVPPARSAHR